MPKVELKEFLEDVKQILTPLKTELIQIDERLKTLEAKQTTPQFTGKMDFKNPELQTSEVKQKQCWEELAGVMRKWGISNVNCQMK